MSNATDDHPEYHPYSNYFPLMRGEEFQDLVSDIEENGLLEPIIRYEGKILDGRNRWRACKKAGVTPEFTEYEGDSPIAYVISMNARRRHMEPAQLALCVREMKGELQEEIREELSAYKSEIASSQERDETGFSGGVDDGAAAGTSSPGRWTERAAEASGTSTDTVRRVDRVAREAEDPDSPVREEAQEMVEEIREGNLGAKPAEQKIKRLKEEKQNGGKSESERRAEAAREKLAEAERAGNEFRAALQDLVQEGHTDYLGAGDAAKIGSILQQVDDAAGRLYETDADLLEGADEPDGRAIEVGA